MYHMVLQAKKNHVMDTIKKLLAIFIMTLLAETAAGGNLYAYVDKHGTRILTNIGYRGSPAGDNERPVPGLGIESRDISPDAVYYEDLIRFYSSRHQVSKDLIKAIIQVESNYDPWAVSIKNCKGLMQLHPDTARRFGVVDIFNPEENIAGGVKYMSFLIEHFDQDLDLALAAYNSGENTVKKYNGIPPYPETVQYVEKVKQLAGIRNQEAPKSRPVQIRRLVDSAGNVILTNH